MTPDAARELTLLRRARDLMDRDFAQPLDVRALAAQAHMSPAHFSRRFAAVYDETPYSYLCSRRIERAMALLRAGAQVTEACTAVGATSLGSFSARFRRVVGVAPTAYAALDHRALAAMPGWVDAVGSRPVLPRSSRIRAAPPPAPAVPSPA